MSDAIYSLPIQNQGLPRFSLGPTRLEFREAFDEVVREIECTRNTNHLGNDFHQQIASAVFDACWSALENFAEAVEQRRLPERASPSELRAVAQGKSTNSVPPRLHVVSAPMGAGKTTFTIAFIVAMVRLSKLYPQMPYGCVYLTDQIV